MREGICNKEESNSVTYSVRASKRAKRLHLKINRLAQIEVVKPVGTPLKVVEHFVTSNLTWIKSQIDKILSQNSRRKFKSDKLPDKIYFPSVDKTYQVIYQTNEINSRYRLQDNVLTITAKSDLDKRQQLREFVHAMAKTDLTYELNVISLNHNLPFNKVFIRAQKTRWGSCSSKKNINLNRNILFLSVEQMKYLIIHELCHTQHLNHSSRYWELVERHYPGYKMIDKSLRNATDEIPLWAIAN